MIKMEEFQMRDCLMQNTSNNIEIILISFYSDSQFELKFKIWSSKFIKLIIMSPLIVFPGENLSWLMAIL